ncbi:MAG TPA: hypothetical protein VFP54_11715 [Acidimicrobiales bacterium]|nr:hypothetical protein [Acidimicrobiales bacterium]
MNCALALYMAFAVRGMSDDLNSASVVYLTIGAIALANLVFVLRRVRPSDRDAGILLSWFTWTAVVAAAGWAVSPVVPALRAHGSWAGAALAVVAVCGFALGLAGRFAARARPSAEPTSRRAAPPVEARQSAA